MKTIRGSNPRRGRLECLALMAVLAVLFCAQIACAMPRSTAPPYPERAPLYAATFDASYFAGARDSQLQIAGLGTLDESWSGYALQRTGAVIPFVVPALDSMGNTNISCDLGGSFRFWIQPAWSSSSVSSGGGPGSSPGTVLELDAVSGGQSALAWSLQISADGNTLGLFAETGSGLQEVLQAPIAWMAGQPHCLALVDDPAGTILYVDGCMAAQGSGLPSIPLSAGQLVIGSTLAGGNAAGADFDEFSSFSRLLSPGAVGMYWQWYSGLAGLGPYYPPPPRLQRNLASSAAFATIYDPDNATPCSLGGPCYITNFSATPSTDGTTTVSFNIQGGTNGVFCDLYSTANLQNTIAASDLSWLCQVLPCHHYVLSNQPPNAAFYLLPPFQLTQVVGWGDDTMPGDYTTNNRNGYS